MIRKAIWTVWDDSRKKTNGGFSTKKDLASMLALSLENAGKQFEELELITNTEGRELLIDKYELPFTSVKVVLDQFNYNLDPDLWAYVKIYAYSIQESPFIHIDNDVIIWDEIPKNLLTLPLLFQNKEYLAEHTSYFRLLNEAKGFPKVNFELMSSNPEYAYNCGIVGCNDLEVIKEWKILVDEYLFHPKNKLIWNEIEDKHSHNHLFEQYFISSLIKINSIETDTLLADDFYKAVYRDFKYTHLWGETKRSTTLMTKIRERLFKDYPQYKDRFSQKGTHSEIFENIYRDELWGKDHGSGGGSTPSITFEYRKFLQDFLKEKEIKSIIDYGCGDFQFMRLIDLDGIDYLGIDCVKSLIETNNITYRTPTLNFKFNDNTKLFAGGYDLLIIKDVFIHWTNQEILDFLNDSNQKSFKYILITNQVENKENTDIETPGQYHSVNLNLSPFNLNLKEIFCWTNDPKITYLIENVNS